MTTVKITKAQETALAWLPADGSWRSKPSRLSRSLDGMAMKGLCKYRYVRIGPSERLCVEWQATPAGLALKAQRQGV